MTPKHIVHIIPTLRFGGAERFVVDLINHSDPAKFKFTIITFFADTPLAAQITNNTKVIVVEKHSKLGFCLKKGLVKVLRELKPDAVHTHLFGSDVWGKQAAHELHLPVVTTEHNINVDESKLKSLVKRFSNKPTDFWIANSEVTKRDMIARYGLKNVNIPVIHYGIDLAKWQQIKPVDFSVKPTKLVIVGRLVKQKGHEIVLKALADLKNYPWQLEIVGDGDLKTHLENVIKNLHLSDRVSFKSATADVVAVLAQNEVQLVPSLWEGLGIVVMEGQVAGRLVVAAQTGGILELLSENTGYLVKPGVVSEWQKILAEILSQSLQEQETKINNAQTYAVKNFGFAPMVKAYEKIYQQLI